MRKNNPATQKSHFRESKERSTYRQERRKKKKVNKSKESGVRGCCTKYSPFICFPFCMGKTISFLSALFPVFDWITVAKTLTEPSVYIQQ